MERALFDALVFAAGAAALALCLAIVGAPLVLIVQWCRRRARHRRRRARRNDDGVAAQH
jgi:hypothetical protein